MRSRTTSNGPNSRVQTPQGGLRKTSSDEKLDRLLDLLNRPQLKLDHAKEVKQVLKSMNHDKKWLVQFLQAKGLHLLSAQLVNFHTNPDVVVGGTDVQLELLLCMKSAMNSQLGLEVMTQEADLVSSLALNVDCADPVICTQTLELLTVLMVSGEGGSKTVLDALDFFKLVKRERVRFQSLVDVLLAHPPSSSPAARTQSLSQPQQVPDTLLGQSSSISLKRDVLFFLNTVVNSSLALEDRLEIRADLIYAGVLPAIEALKLLCFDELVQDVDVDVDIMSAAGEGGSAASSARAEAAVRRVEELHELESQLQVFETVRAGGAGRSRGREQRLLIDSLYRIC